MEVSFTVTDAMRLAALDNELHVHILSNTSITLSQLIALAGDRHQVHELAIGAELVPAFVPEAHVRVRAPLMSPT